MIPKITTGGRSFKGAFQYYLHDKGKATRERVAWTHTENLLTDDPDKAWKVMAYTAKEAERLKEASGQKTTGRKLTQPVFAYSLSWHPEQDPDQSHMLTAARKSLEILGFTDHETVIISHRDEPQKHVHVIVNRVHPLTGIAGNTGNSKRKLSDFAREYEREHGKVYCQQREDNHRKRTQGEKTQYRDQVIVQAWQQSDNGRGFVAALKDSGYTLAQGRKRIVIVDRYGQTHNPLRHLENVRAKDLQSRLRDMALARLPDADKISKAIQKENRRRYDESLRYDTRATHQTNALQNKHLEQRAQISNRYDDRLNREREQLSNHYHLDEQQAGIAALRQKASRTNWLKQMLGITKRQQARLEELELNRRNAEWRMQEKLGQTQAEREISLVRLKEEQQAEQKRVSTDLQKQLPTGYVDKAERDKMEQFLRTRRTARGRDGPSLEH